MATRIKSRTLAAVPQSKDDCADAIFVLGHLQREFERERSAMNDELAEIAKRHQPTLASLQERMDALQKGVQAWCEAHRVELCGEGDRLGKTANLVTGEVSWRIRPPSVRVIGADAVVQALLDAQMERFVRTRHEVDKQAVLAEPEAVADIPGLHVASGVEDFIVVPFGQTAEVA